MSKGIHHLEDNGLKLIMPALRRGIQKPANPAHKDNLSRRASILCYPAQQKEILQTFHQHCRAVLLNTFCGFPAIGIASRLSPLRAKITSPASRRNSWQPIGRMKGN